MADLTIKNIITDRGYTIKDGVSTIADVFNTITYECSTITDGGRTITDGGSDSMHKKLKVDGWTGLDPT